MKILKTTTRRTTLGLVALVALAAGPAFAADVPDKPDTLVMRMWPGAWGDAMKRVGEAFTEETGIVVQFDNRPETAVSTLVKTAVAQGRVPPVDIFYGVDMTGYRDTAQGLSQTLTVEDVPNLAHMLPSAMPDSGQWDYVNIAPNIMTLMYRASAFPNGAPTSLSVLVDPAFKTRTYANSGSAPSIAMAALLTGAKVPDEMDKIWDFVETKLAPMRPIMGHDPELAAGFQRNEIDLAFSFPAIVYSLQDDDLKIAMAEEGSYAFNEAVYVPKGLPEDRDYWAKQFVNFLISKPTLEMYCGELVIPCLADGLPVPPTAAADPSFPHTAEDYKKIYTLPIAAYAKFRPEWDAKFDAIMK